MKIRMLPILSLVLGFTLACSGGSTETTSTTPPPPPPPADGKIGIPECDDYVTKMEACIAASDPMAKATMESGLKSTKDAWLQAASIPQTRGTLASSCTTMISGIPANCGSGAATNPDGTPVTAGGTAVTPAGTPVLNADGTPKLNPDGTPMTTGTTTTTTTTTVVTTTDETKKVEEPAKPSSTGARAPARESSGRPADMSRSRDGTSGTRDGKSGSGTSSDGGSGGMGRSR